MPPFYPLILISAEMRERQLKSNLYITPGKLLSPCSTEGEAASTYVHSALPLYSTVQDCTEGKHTLILPRVHMYTLPCHFTVHKRTVQKGNPTYNLQPVITYKLHSHHSLFPCPCLCCEIDSSTLGLHVPSGCK